MFAGDLPAGEAKLALSHQVAINSVALGTPSTVAAWHVKPSYCAISSEDQMIPPQAEQMFAQRMGAKKTITLKSSHVSMLSHPTEVADVIVEATQANNSPAEDDKGGASDPAAFSSL